MHVVGKSDLSTGNSTYASYVLQSHETVSTFQPVLLCQDNPNALSGCPLAAQVFAFTAPYSSTMPPAGAPVPSFDRQAAFNFAIKHGLGVRSVGTELCDARTCELCDDCASEGCFHDKPPTLLPANLQDSNSDSSGLPMIHKYAPCCAGVAVADAAAAFQLATSGGAIAVQPPLTLHDEATGTSQCISEVKLYGDVVLRFVSGSYKVPPMVCNGTVWCPSSVVQPVLITALVACLCGKQQCCCCWKQRTVWQTASTTAPKTQLQQA